MLPDIPWFVYAMLLAPVGLIVVAAIYKYLEVRAASDGRAYRARSWSRNPKRATSG
jgi:hypothetical protein